MSVIKDRDVERSGREIPSGADRGEAPLRNRGRAAALSRGHSDRPAVVVLLRGESLGDGIVHLPAYFALRHAYPDHRIVGLFERNTVFESVLPRVRTMFFDEVRCGFPLDRISRDLAKLLDSLGHVSSVIDFRANRRAVWGMLGSYGRTQRFIANVFGYSLRFGVAGFAEPRPKQNIFRYHRMVEIIAGRRLPYEYQLPQLAAAQRHAAALLPEGRDYFGLIPTQPEFTKTWPLENLLAVARSLAGMALHPVFLIGPAESGLRERIRTAVPQAIMIDVTAAGNDTNYLPWLFLAVADRLAGVVAADCGIGHLVATRNIPILTLAGPTNPWRWRPLTPYWWLLRAQDFGSSAMTGIPVDAVLRAISDMRRWSARRTQGSDLPSGFLPEAAGPVAATVGTMS